MCSISAASHYDHVCTVTTQHGVAAWHHTHASAIELYHAMDMAIWLPQAEAALARVEAGCTPEGTVAKR